MQAPFSTRYEVYESNHKSELKKLIAQGFHRDMAETIMHNEYMKTKGEKAFILLDCTTNKIINITTNPTAVRY